MGEGGGGLNGEGGGLLQILASKSGLLREGGLKEGGGGLNRGFTVILLDINCIQVSMMM